MRKIKNLILSSTFVALWLIFFKYFSFFISKYWYTFHFDYIYLKGRIIFDYDIWFSIRKIFFGFDLGFYLEEIFKFITYEIPIELLKFLPILIVLRLIWTMDKK